MLIAKAFACIEFEDGQGGTVKYMLEDMTLRCDDGRYRTTRDFALVMGVAFPIGVPLGAYTLLWSRRHEIEQRDTRLGGEELDAFSFFYRLYAPHKWWMASVDLIRRLTPAWLMLLDERGA